MKWYSAKFTFFALAFIAVIATPMAAFGQQNNNNNNNNNNNGNNNNGGGGAGGGIYIDAQGTLKSNLISDPSGKLLRLRRETGAAKISKNVAKVSKLRKVSLKRLQAEMARLKAEGKEFPDDMLYMAGLTSVTHVFCYPEQNDIVIAGPAEGYFADHNGFVRGIKTGQSTVQLQDLVAALRTFREGGANDTKIACSIDPTKEGIQRLNQLVAGAGPLNAARVRSQLNNIKRAVQNAVGMQTVTVEGVSPKSHMGHVLVFADYQMKLMGLGLKRVPGVVSYTSKIKGGRLNTISRWFFVPKYDGIRVSEDGLAMTLEGNGVELVTQTDLVDRFGNRKYGAVKGDKASIAFTKSFTKNYKKIELANPIFGELSNVMDLAVVAAFIQSKDYYSLTGLKMDLINSEEKLSIENRKEIKQVGSVVTALFRGGRLMTPVSGGVTISAGKAVEDSKLKVDDSGETEKKREAVVFEGLGKNQWWWD